MRTWTGKRLTILFSAGLLAAAPAYAKFSTAAPKTVTLHLGRAASKVIPPSISAMGSRVHLPPAPILQAAPPERTGLIKALKSAGKALSQKGTPSGGDEASRALGRLFDGEKNPPTIEESVEALAGAVDREYFDPNVAGLVASSLRQSLASNAYAKAATPKELAHLLTRDMFALTHDKHLIVAPADAPGGSPLPEEERKSRGRGQNWGMQRVEILPGNIGYLNNTGFHRDHEARGALAAAMQFLQHAGSLIIDLRANLGGSPDIAALMASYLLDKPGLPLFKIVHRDGSSQMFPTEAGPLLGRDGKRSLYLLTSADTFSAGEGLAFILREQKRVTVVGETTAGAANPGATYRINDIFSAFIPNGQVRGAVSGGNWEGIGVAPDISVPAADALRVAQEALRGPR